MAAEKKKKWVNVVGFMMILSAVFLLILPVLSWTTIDYGKPSIVKWDSEGEVRKIIVKYEEFDDINVTMFKLQEKLYFPVKLTFTDAFIGSFSMFFVFVFFMGLFVNIRKEKEKIRGLIISAFVIGVVALIVWPLVAHYQQDVENALKKTITDEALAVAAISYYWKLLICVHIIAASILMICVGAACLIAAGVVRAKIWEDFIVEVYEKWKKRVFNDILKNRPDSLLSNYFVFDGVTVEGADINQRGEALVIQPNGVIELVTYNYHLEWKPFPIFVLTKQVQSSISIDNFFRHMMSDSKDAAFDELREKLMGAYRNRFGQIGEKAISDFTQGFAGQTREKFNVLMSGDCARQLATSAESSEKVIEKVVKKSLRKFKTEVAKIGVDEIDAILSDFREKLINETHTRISTFLNDQNGTASREGSVLPHGTRFHVQRGVRDILVIEQPPQVRTVFVSPAISGEKNREHFNLAFPYVIFVLIFDNEIFTSCYVYYRNKPLESLDDLLCRPNLTNISGASVCLRFSEHNADGLAARANEVISHFWNSQFNADHSGNYNKYADEEKKLKNYSVWEKNSKKNPMFVFNVDWEALATLWNILNGLSSGFDNFEVNFIETEIRAAFTAAEEEMREALLKKFSEIKVKNKYPEIILGVLKEKQDEMIEQIYQNYLTAFKRTTENKTFDKSFMSILDKSMNEAVRDDFQHLAGEVLIRRRIEAKQLIDKIREGR